LSDYLPAEATDNRVMIDVDGPTSANALIDQFKLPRELVHLVLVNGVFIKPEERDAASLQDGDTLAIWPPVAGGR